MRYTGIQAGWTIVNLNGMDLAEMDSNNDGTIDDREFQAAMTIARNDCMKASSDGEFARGPVHTNPGSLSKSPRLCSPLPPGFVKFLFRRGAPNHPPVDTSGNVIEQKVLSDDSILTQKLQEDYDNLKIKYEKVAQELKQTGTRRGWVRARARVWRRVQNANVRMTPIWPGRTPTLPPPPTRRPSKGGETA